ncbi:MAG: hypothetical protein JO112_04305, partial [Planctomycetes bacterium]|nr:hypothetical protein [Planctomycetota bacterium]
MDELPTDLDEGLSLKTLVGYVNFSEGKPDPRFQKQLSEAYRILALRDEQEPWQVLHELLRRHLEALKAGGGAFRDVSQAEAVVSLVFARLLPAYRAHHADLLFHQKDADLWQPFFLARAFEAVLAQGAPWTEEERIVTGALHQLNDFVGHRPLAILETRPQGEPYDHERVRPLPLWIPGAGAAWGRYQEVVEKALEILAATDPGLLAEASFHLELLEELALDPRAYDHGHPVNRRPNYVFGEWDPHHLDNQGRFRRYVVRQGILEALLDRIEHRGDIDRGEVLFEAAAVLAGTILMAAGTSGSSPTQYDSTTSLGTLLPRIARYRDAFYTDLLKKVAGAHGARLQQEAGRLRQPFGGARQHLNQYLTRQRAAQLQQRHLALLFAHMGYPEASRRQAAAIPAASIRLTSEILNRLTTGQGLVSRGQPAQAAPLLPEVEDLVRRGIACGALPDPWNLLGFQGLFPLSPAREDSVRDLRLDELILMLEALFGLYARLLSEAAAQGEKSLVQELQPELRRLSAWWDRFGSVEVSDVRRLLGREAAASAEGVARALTLWHERGQAAGDLAFWRQHLPEFHSPKALALVCDTLLRKQDYRAAMALLIYWLGQVEQVPLENGEFSFHALALRWMLAQSTGERTGTAEAWALTTRFFDYLEANAEDYWQVPVLETEEDPKESAEEEDDLYSAAYADVTYRDSTDDQEDSAVAEGGVAGGAFELEEQAESLQKRLRFLATVARLWQIAARGHPGMGAEPERIETLRRWLGNAQANHQRLLALVDAVHAYPVPEPLGSQDALMEFDRRRLLK